MNRLYLFIGLFFLTSVFYCKNEKPEAIKAYGTHLELKDGPLLLKIAPDTGGRIASLKFHEIEILSQIRDSNNWYWGSTVWPSPQAAWNWPPPPVMDLGKYKIKYHENNFVILKSPENAYRGIEVEKQIRLIDTSTVRLKYSFFNRSDSIVPIGIWENTRIPYTGKLSWKTGELLKDTIQGLSQSDSISSLVLAHHEKAAKLFIHTQGGEVSYEKEGVVFKKEFSIIDSQRVAPEQAPLEIYFDPIRQFAEIEEHGPYARLGPEMVMSFEVIWKLAKK